MNYYGVKFLLNFDDYDYSIIKYIFNNVRSALNWQFDENFNVNLIDEDIEYQIRDVSNLESNEIDKIIDSFFRFNFDDIINVPLYKFLVLKNSNGLKILANISSLIFDYSSINDFYELFDDLNKSYPKKDLDTYYSDVKDYFDSPDFKKDSDYWINYIFNSSNYVNFYNLKDNAYKSQIINVDKYSVLTFIENHDCSLFDFYGSAFSLYLSRINRIDGCLLKTIVPRKKTDSGVFDKSTLLKIDVNNDDSFNNLLNEFSSAFKNDLNHTSVDVENYLDENVSYYSIYDFNDFDENIRVYTGDYSALTLNIYGNSLELVYNSDLFSDVYVEHMAKNIESLINNVLSSPNQAAGNVDILSNEEKALLSGYCKGETIEVEKDRLFCEAFREHALANPDAVAVDDGVNQISYVELEKSSNSIANDLYENHNVGPGSRVALMLHRDYHFPELVLALNKIGAAYIPIDLSFPVNRIEHMLNISEAKHFITTKAIAESLDLNANIIPIEDLNCNNDADVEILSKSEDLFAILFTSGTTGIPKGVMFHNKQFPWFGAAFTDIFNFSYGDVVGSYFSFSFVASLLIFLSLYLGGAVRLFNENEQKNSLLLIKTLKETHMNSLILPPSVGIPIFENEDLNLDYLILAGAKLNELSKKDRHTKLVNFYGTTEVIFAISKIYDLKDIEDDRVPIGRPVANTWNYILDENGNQMPIGVPGEICISSEGITQGYYNYSQSTSKVYVDNPFCDSEINKRMYCTGDIGFYNFDGEIEIIGREDDQLSVRGFRVESKEVLSIIRSFKEISDIYLDVDYDNLIAYYATVDDLDINEVKDALKNELPYYMVPSFFIELEKIPLNINGKIDKSSLRVVTNNENTEITDEVIFCVVDAFKEVLNQDVVLIDDDFVSLGGNSLSAMKLQLLLKEKLDVSLSSNELIDLSTPQDIANHIKFNLNVRSTVDEDKYSFDELCPLPESQLNVYLDESVNDMGTAYNNSFKIDFKENYSAGEIRDALIKLFEAFPILKARVLNDDGVLSFAFDAEPEIIDGSLNDMQSFVKPFEFDKYLSRFLVVDDGATVILCADFHHLIFDGTSLNILLNKLFSILNGEDIDFVDKGPLRQIAFEEIIDSNYMDNAREFFDSMLADKDEVYDLLPSLNGKEDEFELIDTFDIDMEHLSSFLQSHSITYNQFFTSVFAYTLSRFSGSDKVLFNIIENGRGHIDLTESVGMFVKTLPVLMDCKNQEINSYLKYSSNLINSVMKYDLYPFRILASEYDLNSNILFQYSHDLFSEVVNKEDLKYSVDELKHDLNADLAFFILNNGENRLTVRILYSPTYSKSFIKSFTESYKLILNEIIKVDELKDINYTSDSDIELLDIYNQTEHDLVYEDILDAFKDNLLKYPENKLVEHNDVSYTFSEGAYITDAIGKKLIDLGVKTQDKVSFLVPRSELYMFCALGVMSVGGIYVPLDDNLPNERIEFMIKDTDSKVLIVSDETYQRGCDLANDCIILNISDIVNGKIKPLNELDIAYGDLACILYTSGSTGIPKGVKITRKCILNFIESDVIDLDITTEDVYGLFASIGFDVAMAAIFSAVYTGCCLNIIPEDIRLNIKALNNHFVKYGVTHTFITTPVAKLFIQEIESTSLKVLVVGGEKLGEINANRHYKIVDAYGPTEAYVVMSTDIVDKIDSTSVGYVQNNTKAYILDDEKRRVPIGGIGELYLSGYQLADGYLNREKETSHAFMDNPYEENPNYNQLYRTGDMARLLPDKTYGIVGRRDSQVKIRGNRVELSEIEVVIREIDYIDDVTVQTIENNSNSELVAYVVASDEIDELILKNHIQDYVHQHKPEYMVPSFVIILDEIPLNVNGKVDKRALPDVDFTSLHEDYVAPTTEDEKIIVEAFEKVFNHKIGIYDDFVHLGGDSLTAIKLLTYLEDYNITAVDILSLHTPYAIAKNIKKIKLDLDVYTLESGCPLNESQLNVYLDIAVNNKYDAYIIPLFMEIPEKYGVDEIFDALNKIIDIHPILSMRISDEFEVPYLVKGSNPSIIVENNVSDDFIIEFINMPFDLQESLCRFLITNDNDNCKLFAAFNHIIFDGLSANVFKRDMQAILDGESISVDDSFLKVSAFSQQIQNTDEYVNAKNFYESMLIDNEETSTLMESIDSNEQGKLKIDLDLDINLLKSFLDKHGVSENVLFAGSFAYALSRFTGYENASFNLVENGRDRFNNFNSIGMYANTLPILVNCKNQNVASFMENTSSLIYDAMRYNYYPFRLLANEYNINLDILFQFLPEWIGNNEEFDKNNSLNDNENKIITQRDNQIADLIVEVAPSGEEYNLNITYCDKFSKNFVEHFAKSYKLILQQIINIERLEEIDYITSEDIEILDSYNQTQHPLKHDDILDAFNDNLAKYENNVLVGYEGISYTHGQGAFIANEVANRLDNLSIAKQDYIALFVNRGEWFLLASMGVLSMGGIYVPIETSYPDERIILMLEDTKSKVVIVDRNTEQHMKNIIAENDLNIDVLNVSDIIACGISTSNHLNTIEVNDNDVACVLYTSGTTGVPKGVLVTRKAINNFVSWYVDETNFTSHDVYGMHCSYVFDMHTHALYSPVITGGSLYIVPEDIRLDLKDLNNYFVEHGCTHTYMTSQLGKLFAESGMETTIKLLCFGGMKLGELNAPDSIGPFESYGPSENLAISTSIFANKRIHHSSIGRFISNVKGYVLDKELRRVPLGAVGELYLSGAQLTSGYLNRQEENDKSFFDNPFDDEEGYNHIYGTGDMVRFLPDGTLGIIGRRDGQVKIRGNRVELTEVESTIRSMGNIEDVTVQIIENNGNNELVAYIVLYRGFEGNDLVDCVREYVTKRKPEYMVPSYVVELDEIPLNVNGKVDKSSLPDVDVGSLHAKYVAPTDETEKRIVDAFEVVFNQKGIGLNDDFVRLGGDSISAIRVISLLEKNGITCSARDILNYKTPYLIAQNIQSIGNISYDAVQGVMDLLPIQEYFFNQVNSNNFTQSFILKSNEKIDKDILQRSFNKLCNVHDMLRANYRFDENGKVIQEILPVDSKICEINEYNISDNLEESLKDIYLESSNLINIENKLIEINLINHNSKSYLMFIIHHLIIDGASWNILISDLTQVYSNLKQGNEIELIRPYPYKNWVEDVKNLVDKISPNENQHWREINNLLDDFAIKGNANSFSFNVDVNYDLDNLLMLSEEEYLALAIARAYKKTYGKDIIFNRESHGRDESIAKLNRTIGWFTSQYPILVNTNNDYDDVSLMNDVYSIKAALKEVNNLGLNYSSLVYTNKELEFKHCPVTFNFLSSEFTFKNELFESIMHDFDYEDMKINDKDSTSYGVTFNVSKNVNSYNILGDYAENTYIGDEITTFIENIKSELKFIANFNFKDNNIVCCLSESQLGIYLDEKAYEKGTAYSTPGIFEYESNKSNEEIKEAIHALINKHPILKGRILDTNNIPLLICDTNPSIEIIGTNNYRELIKPFDLSKSLARFYIVDNEDSKIVFYDMHHIISDATSRTIINKELKLALMGKLDNKIDWGFVYANHDSFESQYDYKYKSAQKFFHDEFAEIDDVQYLLSDVDGSIGSVSLPIKGVREKLELFTQKNGITVGSLLNAVFAYTYSRFTGSNKVYYNFTEHGRHESYMQNALGMFVRTIPVLVDCENRPISEFVVDMSDLILKSMANSSYPFRLLAREFDLSNEVVFEYNYDLIDFDIGNDMVVSEDADGVSEFLCVVNDLEDGFVVSVSHLDKFSQYTAKQFVKTFKEILIQILEKENLADINYITSEDIEILDSYNQTQHPLKHDDILDAFNDNLAKYENNVLVGYEGISYTHGQGAFIANEVANRLDNLSIAKQDYIALFVNRGEWFLLASMGVLSMGGIYVPIETSYPDERIILMLEDTKSKVVIVDRNTEQHMKNIIAENDLNIDVLNVSDIIACGISTSNHLNTIEVNDNDVACVLYTSGTTGVPKGVLVTRKAINNFVSWYVDETNFTSHDVYGMHCSYVFDMHTHALYSPVITGGSLYIVPEDIRLDLKDLNNYFVEHGCTHTYMTSQLGKLFAESGMETTIKLLCFGGMKLGELNAPDSIGPFESYGPSENLAISTSIFANKRIHHSSIGRFISNVKGYVLDKELRRVPLGAVGELYLSGAQLTSGYLNRQEENDKSFFDNPFDDEEGYNHIYGTGDMVRFLPDGTLGIIGRRDGQVKIRGNRVELTEVESTIRSMGNIEDVTVQIIENNGNNELVAYIVLYRGFEGNDLVDCVREYVTKRKPEYMVPSYVVELDEIPLNVNGKVDKSSLPEIDKTSLHAEYVSPRNENEKEIVKAFENALNLEKVGIYDDFIRLGGDSLTAIRLLSDIKSNDVTMADILTFRTPEAIAKNMSDFSFDLDLYTLESGCPLNAAQLNVFADVTIYNKRNAYHIPGYIPISKEYGLEDILNALDELLNVHPILGMRLSERYEINDSDDISNLDMITDLIKIAKKFGIKEIMKLINAYGLKDMGGLYNMIKTTTRLLKGEYPYMENGEKPPISVKSKADKDTIIDFLAENLDIYNNLSKFMIVETEESYYLFYVIHHIIFDAVSAGVFKHDFETLLDGGSVGLDDTFLKASAYTQQIKNTDKFEEASEYYYPILSSIDDVGTLLEDNTSEGYSISTYDLKFDKPAFRSFLNNAGISENVLFTSVFAYALSQFVDGDKVLFTLVENGRDRFNENFIGMTSNVMPLVADCKDQSINSFMENMADTVYGISRHSYYPILLLYQKYNFEVNILFQFVPNWIADDFINVDDIDSGEIMNHVLNSYSDYLTEFFVQIYQNGDDYRLIITNSNKYSNKLIEDFKDTYISILSNIINMDIDSNLNTTLK